MQFATNHLGHFALAVGLHDALAAAGDARIVSLSSARPPALAGGLRRPALRLPPLRPVAGLRPVQDRQRAVRGRGHAPLGRRRDHRQRGPPGRDRRHQPAAAHGPGELARARQTSGAAYTVSRRSSRAPRPACWSPPRRCSRASAAATSRTATRRRSSTPAAGGRRLRRGRLRGRPGQRAAAVGRLARTTRSIDAVASD